MEIVLSLLYDLENLTEKIINNEKFNSSDISLAKQINESVKQELENFREWKKNQREK